MWFVYQYNRSCGIYANLIVHCHQHWWLTVEPTQDKKEEAPHFVFNCQSFGAPEYSDYHAWNYAIINLRYCMHVCKDRRCRLMQQKLMNWGVHVNVAFFMCSSAICMNLTITAWLILVESSRTKADVKKCNTIYLSWISCEVKVG